MQDELRTAPTIKHFISQIREVTCDTSSCFLCCTVSRNGLLLCVQFVFTTLNNSLLFLVPLRELSRELRGIT